MLNPLRKEKVTTEEYDRDALDEVIRKELRKGVEQLDLPLRAHGNSSDGLKPKSRKEECQERCPAAASVRNQESVFKKM